MKVLIADKFEKSGVEGLRALGCEVAVDPEMKGDALVKGIADSDCEVLIVRSTKVPAAALESGGSLALVVRAGAGVDNIDVKAASALGVFVANCPGRNSAAVAELTMGLMLALDRRLVDNTSDLRAGKWDKKGFSKARGLRGRTLGLIGFGSIGREVAARARAFGMRVVVWSRSLTPERAAEFGVERADSPLAAAREADVLSVHIASAADTRGLITREMFDAMQPGSYFINTSRGDVVAPGALEHAVKERQIRVALDVFEKEPGANDTAFTDPIVQAGGVVYGTHHIGASTDEAQEAIAAEVVRIVERYRHDGWVLNCVNVNERSPARRLLVVRHRNRPGVLAHVLHEISHAEINVEEMDNVILAGALAACARIRLDDAPGKAVLERIRAGNENILGVALLEIPADGS